MDMICPRCWGAKKYPTLFDLCSYCSGTGVAQDVALSPHFNLSELLSSQTAVRRGIPNEPTDILVEHLTTVCKDILEPIRAQFGPIHIDSGYRSDALNSALSGASGSSVHTLGWAADLVPLTAGVHLKSIIEWVISSNLSFDQVIYEGSWIHLGRFSPSGKVRKMPLMAFPSSGRLQYSLYVDSDRRVV